MSPTAFENPTGTREEILAATYRTLCTHGYTDLTIQRIGEEFEKSPSLIYHHYEDKDDLVLSCLAFMLDQFEERITNGGIHDEHHTDPRTRLESFLAWALEPDADTDQQQFMELIVELRARAAHDEQYRKHFERSDRVFERYLTTILEDGVEQEVFETTAPERVAAGLVTTLAGVMVRRSTVESESWLEAVDTELNAYLEACVYAQ